MTDVLITAIASMTPVGDAFLQPLITHQPFGSALSTGAGVLFPCHVFAEDSSSAVGTCRTAFPLYPSETELLISESKPDVR